MERDIFAVYTQNLEAIQLVRNSDESDSSFYFVSDCDDLEKLLEQYPEVQIYVEEDFYDDELKSYLDNISAVHRIFNSYEEILSAPKNNEFSDAEKTSPSFCKIKGKSPQILELKRKIIRYAASDFTVLITGETGTGKSLIASAIHELSSRSGKKIIRRNVSAYSGTLFESEIFGHEKGSFTGAEKKRSGALKEAEGSTFFFDEIGDLDLSLQVKLLTALNEREYSPVGSDEIFTTDARFIFATNANLEKKVLQGKFREDLLSRIKVLQIEAPALRNHPSDIPEIAEKLLKEINPQKKLTQKSLEFLKTGIWRRNVRDLESCLKNAVVMCDDKNITPEFLEFK